MDYARSYERELSLLRRASRENPFIVFVIGKFHLVRFHLLMPHLVRSNDAGIITISHEKKLQPHLTRHAAWCVSLMQAANRNVSIQKTDRDIRTFLRSALGAHRDNWAVFSKLDNKATRPLNFKIR